MLPAVATASPSADSASDACTMRNGPNLRMKAPLSRLDTAELADTTAA